jgi:hypothetical protein
MSDLDRFIQGYKQQLTQAKERKAKQDENK